MCTVGMGSFVKTALNGDIYVSSTTINHDSHCHYPQFAIGTFHT
jgi:hypothetical protein